ncbi:MAG: PHP domain-containing protein [Planctomycetota bacterium]
MIKELEKRLDSFDAFERREALEALKEEAVSGRIKLPCAGKEVNLHCHTFFSYNCYGYSPSKFAWLARKMGLAVAGIVDFDVLDGLEEFLEAGNLVGLKACGGFETRVFVPEFADKVLNSPGEPGIAYHSAVGIPSAILSDSQKQFMDKLKKTARKRNVDLMLRVNNFLKPVELDYDKDVLTLTPSGNATERHICLAYARKAETLFPDIKTLTDFWSEKLDEDASLLDPPQGLKFLNAVRSKTMKCGGVGYVQPDAGAFPKMEEVNQFIIDAGGIPTLPWLDGTSHGEQEIEALIDVATKSGVAAINIVPDRNITTDEKLGNLHKIVELAEKLQLPIVVGTEMNSPGQKFVDDFKSKELSPLVDILFKGACIVYAHSVLQQAAGLGYLSPWAKSNFKDTAGKNKFYEQFGRLFEPGKEHRLDNLHEDISPEQILEIISN